jgi:hypothetical protein
LNRQDAKSAKVNAESVLTQRLNGTETQRVLRMTNRPSVFISYGHKDGMEFVRRLAFALEMYMDVFWDRRLQAGEYPTQLYSEIEHRDYFLFVITPYSLGSEWCEKELSHAEKHGKPISLARVYLGDGTCDPKLTSKYTYGDFTEDFDAGFRRLTAMMLKQPYSSWELLSVASSDVILNYLKAGAIPCIIAKQIAEWVLVRKLWAMVENYIERRKGFTMFYAPPNTPLGMLQLCPPLMEQFARDRDAIGTHLVTETKPILEIFANELMLIHENKHLEAGRIAGDLLDKVKNVLASDAGARREFTELSIIQGWFDFEVSEKLREFINEHSRRSRYLY